MAWLDDRVWCHPKFTDLSSAAGWTYAKGLAYSSGMGTKGVLTPGQQLLVGSGPKVRRELVEARLWDEADDGSIEIHDWDEYNGKRDARRIADRERKRLSRGQSNGTSAGQSAGQSAGRECVDGSEGSEGSEGTTKALDITHLINRSLREVR